GLLTAQFAMTLLTGLLSKELLDGMPYLSGLSLNWHIVLFAFAIFLATAVLFSLTPLLRLPLTQLRLGLTESGRGYAGALWRRFGANLVVIELATAVVLLVCAGLLGKSFYRLLHVEVGFQPDHLATVTVALSEKTYAKEPQQIAVGQEII